MRSPIPYMRCWRADAPEARELQVGRLQVELEGRALRVKAAPEVVRLLVFTGPAPSREPIEGRLRELADAEPDLVLVLGHIGDTVPAATATLRALGELDSLSLVLAGGRDDSETLDAAFEALSEQAHREVVDARPLRRIAVGPDELILVSGAPEGRYARTDSSCGFGAEDLDDAAEELGDRPDGVKRRWLVSWAAPAGWPGSAGLAGVEAGSPALAAFAERVSAEWGLFAWPAARGASSGKEAARVRRVPSVAGVPPATAEASASAPRAVQWTLGPDGPRWRNEHEQERHPSSSP